MADAKFDLDRLRAANNEARARVAMWPAWEREVVTAVFESIQIHTEKPANAK